jgi:phospholipid/cholesterol/gamma-HCH transport system substrate-binding protein
VRNAVDEGRGTLGKLIKDPKAYDDLVKLLGNMERNNVLKRVVRFVIEQDEASDSARPTAKSASGGGSSPAAEPSQPPDPGP